MANEALVLREVESISPAVHALFRSRYAASAPDFPHHVVAWLDDGQGERPLCYIHFTAQGDALLGGGACVDQRLLRRVPRALRESVRAQGGLYHLSLAWSLRHFAGRYRAVFGYCGDALAKRVDLALGFEATAHEYLLVYWLDKVKPRERERMIATAHAVGPF